MPCICALKVDRTQPKIWCDNCKDSFHLECVNLSSEDVDFLHKENLPYYCAVCAKARRGSIRSPPPALSLPVSVPAAIDSHTVVDKQSQRSPAVITAGTQTSDVMFAQLELSVTSLLSEVAVLKAENAQVVSLLQSLCEEKSSLLKKFDDVQLELRSVREAMFAVSAADVGVGAAMQCCSPANVLAPSLAEFNAALPPVERALRCAVNNNNKNCTSSAVDESMRASTSKCSYAAVATGAANGAIAAASRGAVTNPNGAVQIISTPTNITTRSKSKATDSVAALAVKSPKIALRADAVDANPLSACAVAADDDIVAEQLPTAAGNSAQWSTVVKNKRKRQTLVVGTGTYDDLMVDLNGCISHPSQRQFLKTIF